jgi:hypothetical protein
MNIQQTNSQIYEFTNNILNTLYHTNIQECLMKINIESPVILLEKIKNIHNTYCEIVNDNYRKYTECCKDGNIMNISQKDYDLWEHRMKLIVSSIEI